MSTCLWGNTEALEGTRAYLVAGPQLSGFADVGHNLVKWPDSDQREHYTFGCDPLKIVC